MSLQKIVENFIRGDVRLQEDYAGDRDMDMAFRQLHRQGGNAAIMSFFIVYIAVYLLLMLFGQFLWNNYIVEMFSVARPVSSIWHLVALAIVVKLIIY
jgi:hypothetical protein